MPDDRLLHRCQGFSAKLSGLGHLAYRVWVQYLLSADDFGVLPNTASAIRGANLALSRESESVIIEALSSVLAVGLVGEFEHQGQLFLWSPNWQDYQKIRYPRTTYLPMPDAETFAKSSANTAELFEKHPAFSSIIKPTKRRANYRLTANGSVLPEEDTFEPFWASYPNHKSKAAALKAWTKLAPDADLRAVIAAALAWQKRSVGWLKDGGAYVPHASTWLNGRQWEDEGTPGEVLTDDSEAFVGAFGEWHEREGRGAFVPAMADRIAAARFVVEYPDASEREQMARLLLRADTKLDRTIPTLLHHAARIAAKVRA